MFTNLNIDQFTTVKPIWFVSVFFFILPKLLLGCIYIAAACLHIDGEMAACYIIMFYCIYQHQQIRKNISLAPGSSALEMLLSQLNLNEALAVQLL